MGRLAVHVDGGAGAGAAVLGFPPEKARLTLIDQAHLTGDDLPGGVVHRDQKPRDF